MREKYTSQCSKQQSKIVSQDRGQVKHVALNTTGDEVAQYHIDDSQILGNNNSCCDYLIFNDSKKRAYFIELKGRDLCKAKSQVLDAEHLFVSDLTGYTRFYRIVYRTGSHRVQNQAIIQWKRLCGKEDGTPVVVIKQGQYEEPIDS